MLQIGHDTRFGQLTYVRVYTGEIKNMDSLYNANKGSVENKFNVHIPHSDQLQLTSSVKVSYQIILSFHCIVF